MPAQKTYYGVSIGILMVNSTFRRYLGDIGNAETWSFPVQYKIVHDAVPTRMTDLHNASLLEPFKRAADELIAAGVDGITTTCGFLSIYQKELADHCSVPVATSSLLQVPMVERMLPTGKRVGILTYNGDVLNGPYLEAVGISQDTPVIGVPQDSNFVRWIKEGDNSVTFDTLRREVVAAAETMIERHPDVGAIVSECTNLAPFTYDISKRLGIPVYDTVAMVNLFHASLRPRRYQND
ncbi:aspartate/glutamate racemase family protein [Pseudaminobacter arsenicus]|uniref:Aspartate/glutamate racemase family protein n=1 Tax=Borborobacter arsenicus TaxID=1851146 RepID=A0A432V140_9HYPH|nr:aspartate/glutamate racemase family protein [Pseudaminobacter arsenicus]RUM95815.1 aspartate/glutamate racemase family protein [Pseudaminobacter arsenicus]